MPWFVSFDDQDRANHMRGRASFGFVAVSTGMVVKKSFKLWNALEASSFHLNLSDFRSSLKNGKHLSPSQLMNRLRAAMHPINFIRSFLLRGGFMFLMALTLVGLALMPRLLMKKPRSFQDGHQKCTW
jgi:hypothetical protein